MWSSYHRLLGKISMFCLVLYIQNQINIYCIQLVTFEGEMINSFLSQRKYIISTKLEKSSIEEPSHVLIGRNVISSLNALFEGNIALFAGWNKVIRKFLELVAIGVISVHINC